MKPSSEIRAAIDHSAIASTSSALIPWQHGTCENTNGLIRDFFPKGTNFHTVSKREIKHVQDLLNGRPRKALAFRTPAEVFDETLLNC